MNGDDLDMGETGQRFRQEQWDAVRAAKLRDEMMRMAECLGELGRESRRRVRDGKVERRRESHGRWESLAEENDQGSKEAGKAKCGPVVLPGVFGGQFYPGVTIGIVGIGGASSCEVFGCTINCLPIRQCSQNSWALKSVTAFDVRAWRRARTFTRWVAPGCLGSEVDRG